MEKKLQIKKLLKIYTITMSFFVENKSFHFVSIHPYIVCVSDKLPAFKLVLTKKSVSSPFFFTVQNGRQVQAIFGERHGYHQNIFDI